MQRNRRYWSQFDEMTRWTNKISSLLLKKQAAMSTTDKKTSTNTVGKAKPLNKPSSTATMAATKKTGRVPLAQMKNKNHENIPPRNATIKTSQKAPAITTRPAFVSTTKSGSFAPLPRHPHRPSATVHTLQNTKSLLKPHLKSTTSHVKQPQTKPLLKYQHNENLFSNMDSIQPPKSPLQDKRPVLAQLIPAKTTTVKPVKAGYETLRRKENSYETLRRKENSYDTLRRNESIRRKEAGHVGTLKTRTSPKALKRPPLFPSRWKNQSGMTTAHGKRIPSQQIHPAVKIFSEPKEGPATAPTVPTPIDVDLEEDGDMTRLSFLDDLEEITAAPEPIAVVPCMETVKAIYLHPAVEIIAPEMSSTDLITKYEQILSKSHHSIYAYKSTMSELRQMILIHGLPLEPLRRESISLRARVWFTLLDIQSMHSSYYLDLVQRGPCSSYEKIKNDAFRTWKTEARYHAVVTEAKMLRVLNAVIRDSETSSAVLTYKQGMNVLAAPFCYLMPEVAAFECLKKVLFYYCPQYVQGSYNGVSCACLLFDQCLEKFDPELFQFLQKRQLNCKLASYGSMITLCADRRPLDQVLVLWDFLLCYGVHFNVLCVLAMYLMNRDEIMASIQPRQYLEKQMVLEARPAIKKAIELWQQLSTQSQQIFCRHVIVPALNEGEEGMKFVDGQILVIQ